MEREANGLDRNGFVCVEGLGVCDADEISCAGLSWKCRRFRCHPLLVLTTCLCVFPTRRPDTADVSATSCDVGFFFSVSYVVMLPDCRHVVGVTTYHSIILAKHMVRNHRNQPRTTLFLAITTW
jgi:hypothetical protein